ncbi:MAG TPA: hypothetical protein VE398_25135 [Acidobacteriota bacterium]|nr:hypothetical protein [Acidobacteriota bacterium]
MPGKPYQSSLNPYEDEIISLRRRCPPLPYAKISELLRRKYQVRVCRETIFKFLRAKSRRRKMTRKEAAAKWVAPAQRLAQIAKPASDSPPKPKFEFAYSERYSLKRLPKDEAAAIRKKLEEEGH